MAKRFPLDLSKFKKVAQNDRSTTLQHPDGHNIMIAHHVLSPKMKDQLDKLPKNFVDGGDVEADQSEAPSDSAQAPMEIEAIPEAAPMQSPQLASASLSPPQPTVSAPQMPVDGGQVAPPQSQAMPSMPGAPAPDYSQAMGQYQQGIQSAANAQSEQAKANAMAIQKQQIDMQTNMGLYQKNQAEIQKHIDDLNKDMQNQHFDARRYINNMPDGQKTRTAIGLMLGGIGSAFTHQGNPAQQFLQSQIDKDVEMQKEEFGKKKTLLEANYRQLGNMKDATLMTQAMIGHMIGSQMQLAAANATDKTAQANAQMAASKFNMEYVLPKTQQLAMIKTLQQGTQAGTIRPAQYVQYVVPKEHQAEVFKEIKRAEDTRDITPKIKEAFHMASSRNPVTASQGKRAFEALMNTTVQDQEGTVKQAAIESVHNTMTPSGLFASPGENETKEKSVDDYLAAKSSAPVAFGYGIDLEKFPTTKTPHRDIPVERITPDGKVALFDKGTKKFLGYK